MEWIIIIIIVVAIIAFIMLQKLKNKNKINQDEEQYPYEKHEKLFTAAERSFLGVLMQTIGKDAQVFGKTRVADVLKIKKGLKSRQKFFNKIQSKHFDFIICNKNNLSILFAIELNDSSHNSQKRKDRDVFLREACKSANLPLIEITAKRTYSSDEIKKSIQDYMPN